MLSAVIILMEHGIDLSSKTESARGRTLLTHSMSCDADSVVEHLLEISDVQKIEVDETNSAGYAAMHLAVNKGRLDWTKALIKHNAKLNKRDRTGRTPLMLSVRDNRFEILAYLLENGADP